MGVDEFGAVVRVDPAQRKRQLLAQLVERLLHAHLAFPQDGAGFHPRRVDVGQVERVQKVAVGAVPGVTDQVDLREARLGHVPVIGLDRNVVFQQRPRFRPAVLAPPDPAFVGGEHAIDLPRADRPHCGFDRGRQREALPRPRQPERQQRLQPHRPGIPGRGPDRLERPHDRRPIPAGPARPTAGARPGPAGRRHARISALR